MSEERTKKGTYELSVASFGTLFRFTLSLAILRSYLHYEMTQHVLLEGRIRLITDNGLISRC